MGRVAAGAAWLAVAALAFATRAATARDALAGGAVLFPVGDAPYHLRRALYTIERWPRILTFDPLVSYPEGSWIAWPPLHDLLLAGLGLGLGGSPRDLELAALWWPPLCGALAALAAGGAGTRLGGLRLGLGAAALFALLPASVAYSHAGNADHHCTVSLFGALWLWGALAACAPAGPRAARAAGQALLTAARTGLLLVWGGALLYLAIAETTQIAVLALRGRSRALAAHAAGLAATAAVLAAVVPALGPPVGGPWSSIALSRLHPTALVAAAAVAAACAALETRRPARSAWQRAVRLGGLGLAAAAALLAIEPLREALVAGLGFVGKEDAWAARNAEQLPLLRSPARLLAPLAHYGGFAYLIPFAPLAALARARDPRRLEPGLVLAGWAAGFGLLAMVQLRYGNDYAAPGSVAFALVLVEGRRVLLRRLGARAGRPAALALAALLAGPLVVLPAWRLPGWLERRAPLGDPLAESVEGSLHRFGEAVRAATPETPGFDDPDERPSYGILCPPNVGHALRWTSRRAMVIDNFGPYLDPPHFAAAQGFYALRSEAEAAAVAERLGAPYVVTMEYGRARPQLVASRLQRQDGRAAAGLPPLERFRLVTEGPAGGRALTELFGVPTPIGVVPYKLWQVVPGARLEVRAPPGAEVAASVRVATPAGRRFRYRALAWAGADGVARLRFPYATEAAHPVRALGPLRVEVDGAVRRVEVPERAVREGAVVAVDGSSS